MYLRTHRRYHNAKHICCSEYPAAIAACIPFHWFLGSSSMKAFCLAVSSSIIPPVYSLCALCVSMSAIIAVRVRSGRSGQALTTSAKSRYSCTKLSKPVDKTEFEFFVSALFSLLCKFPSRGSNPLGAILSRRAA